LRKAIPYGHGVTLLFTGPPGVGKTASAEALAHELRRPILIADYSRIQNCLVGMTEKNITRIFREARARNAVLFWDEADAMFYDRDMGYRTWEVRDVNVLLQEIERFEGVCVLATNRRVALDKALERRISLRVEFTPPDDVMRRQIWRLLLPSSVPLSEDVDLGELAKVELTGGEIKNVILNAARMALIRGARTTVTDSDFRRAVSMETETRWVRGNRQDIGFRASGAHS